ncbi:MAG: DNA translocase FtsK, partial [Eubacteriales bacterium]
MSTRKSTKKENSNYKARNQKNQVTEEDTKMQREITLVCVFAVAFLIFLSNFGVIGTVGNHLSSFMFGLIGFIAYFLPIVLIFGGAFYLSNRYNPVAMRKMIAGLVLYILIGMIAALFAEPMGTLVESSDSFTNKLGRFYENSSTDKNGGGVILSMLAYGCIAAFGKVGTFIVMLLIGSISFILITQKSIIRWVKRGGTQAYYSAKEEAIRQKERMQVRREEERILRKQRIIEQEERTLSKQRMMEQEEQTISKKKAKSMIVPHISEQPVVKEEEASNYQYDMYEYIPQLEEEKSEISFLEEQPMEQIPQVVMPEIPIIMEEPTVEQPVISPVIELPLIEVAQPITPPAVEPPKPVQQVMPSVLPARETSKEPAQKLVREVVREPIKPGDYSSEYHFPPISLLKASDHSNNKDASKVLKDTAVQLEKTLLTFGVKVTVTEISQGPTVTRYELQPELGVKVSKIVGLADDIKLNLAATDIRIEAPIPGKAAVGIEVPNKENSLVVLRDLLETDEFTNFDSKLAFAVGKDIGGKTVVSDIAKMPHMLVAGSTGSGKSVCINTLIMSVLYKAHPDDVKLIMIDPKVVELSVYNGIPHLLIPVVTDPKKAAGALHWGVAEMTDRYKKFADFNVRDLKSYNENVAGTMDDFTGEIYQKLPQIIIIVDELADLMMVAPGEVESSICRLAQLARAAGIHLIIATQRPSVDVITGLIKANMPSRVAFAVSSGVDSRTILDMNGAEKLLGKGDMLFYPQGYSKPGRVQGAFVSDKEVSAVVNFLKNQTIGNVYNEEVTSKIELSTVEASGASNGGT